MLYSPTKAPVNFRSTKKSSRTGNLPTLVMLLGGCSLNALAFGEIEPIVASLGLFGLGLVLLNISPLRGHYETVIFARMCAVGWFMAGIAAIYDNFLTDTIRNDAIRFYYLSVGLAYRDLNISQFQKLTEGSAAVVVWRAFYDSIASLGIDRKIYTGILVNVLTLATTGVISIKIVKVIYGYDVVRLRRLITLFSFCGIFWLFAAIHLRDVFALLMTTVLIYVFNLYIKRPNIMGFAVVMAISIIFTVWFDFIRSEFVFVPSAIGTAALTSQAFFYRSRGQRKLLVRLVAVLIFIVSIWALPIYLPSLLPILSEQNLNYLDLSRNSASSNSLGLSVIVNQPLAIKLVLGSVWVLVFPLPVWSGFQLESPYHLFKSLNAIYMYFLVPLFGLGVLNVVRKSRNRNPLIVFNLVIVLGFLLSVVATSVESRHFGTFLVAMFMVALQPDLTHRAVRMSYKNILSAYLMGILLLHVIWALLKLS